MLAAVEPSGDALGAALLSSLKNMAPPDTEYFGCGGPLMESEGFRSLFPIESLSVMGFTDVARALPLGFRCADKLSKISSQKNTDAAIFIDGWAFSRIGAKRLRERSARTAIYKFAAPQVWASRPQRVQFVRQYFNGVLTLLPFEPPYFEEVGVRTKFVGNPTFQSAWSSRGDGEGFRRKHGLQNAPVLAVLLGSRKSELLRLEPVFRETVKIVIERKPDLRVIIPLAPNISHAASQIRSEWADRVIIIEPDEKYDAFAAADAALAASGTVTTELAINNTPMIIAYKVDPLTAFWARMVVTTKFASILNVAAGRAIIPEFIQEKCKPADMANALNILLENEDARKDQLESFAPLLASLNLSGPPAAKLAAQTLLEWIATDTNKMT